MARPHVRHFTIRGIRVLWRYTRLRGAAAGWAIMPDQKNPRLKHTVLIDSTLKKRARLETELHEALHHAFPDACESVVTEAGASLARILWSLYRMEPKDGEAKNAGR